MIFGITNPVVPIDPTKTPGQALGIFISSLVGIFLIIASLWAGFQLFMGAFLWISSGGDKAHVEAARNRMTNAVIGLVLLFTVWFVYLLILQFFGIIPGGSKGLDITFPTLL